MHQDEASLRVEFKDKAPRSDAAPEQSMVRSFEGGDVARERVVVSHRLERGIDARAISDLHRTHGPSRGITEP